MKPKKESEADMTIKLVWDGEKQTVPMRDNKSYIGRLISNQSRMDDLNLYPIYSGGAMALYQHTYEVVQDKNRLRLAEQMLSNMDWSSLND